LSHEELSTLAKKTTVLIATVGPYALYGEHAVKACAENGTHYLDVTGEVAWVANMIKKYERTAKSTGAILISQIGIESAPADLVTWTLAGMIREKFSAPTAEVIVSVHEFRYVRNISFQATRLTASQGQTIRRNSRYGSRPHGRLQSQRTGRNKRTLRTLPHPRSQNQISNILDNQTPGRQRSLRPRYPHHLPRRSSRPSPRPPNLGSPRWPFFLRPQFPLQRVHESAKLPHCHIPAL
jgi:short subunit dehydrogenase-like uncharacterized protein